MPSTREGPALGFAVPDELLRGAVATAGADDAVADLAFMPGVGDGKPPPLRDVLRRHGVRPLFLISAAAAIAQTIDAGIGVLGPDIERTFHIKDAALGAVSFVSFAALFGLAVPIALAGDRGARRTIAGFCLLSWAIAVPLLGLAPSVLVFALLLMLTGFGRAAVNTVHLSYLSDYYPIEARARVIAWHRASDPLSATIGAAVIGGIAALAGGHEGWRWAMLIGLLGIPVGLALLRLPEPAKGEKEQEHILGAAGLEHIASDGDEPRVLFSAALTRLLRIKTIYYQLIGVGMLGVVAAGVPIFLSLLLDRRFHLDAGRRGLVISLLATPGFLSVVVAGFVGDRLYRRDPRLPLRLGAVSLVGYGGLLTLSVHMPNLPLFITCTLLANACVAPLTTAMFQTIAATAPASMRSVAFAIFGLYVVAGAFVGLVILGAVSQSKGPAYALSLIGPIAAVGAALLWYGARFVQRDITLSIEDVLEEHAERQRRSAGGAAKALQVHNLDFAYGTQQVLFDVDLEVEEGEICALLGTNGAGKSTILRAVAGLDHPTRGAVRVFGTTTTYLEAEQVAGLGVALLSGGRMTFPSLTVDENLRAGTFGIRKAAGTRAAIDRVYGTFPILLERREQLAGTLSGGEQQMLAIARSLVDRPRIMLIDELTLGLAPQIVQDLLAIVRDINASGTTILLVEQSVNLAVRLADHAFFLERGEVRFDGRTAELLTRNDLLRPVFLGAAT